MNECPEAHRWMPMTSRVSPDDGAILGRDAVGAMSCHQRPGSRIRPGSGLLGICFKK